MPIFKTKNEKFFQKWTSEMGYVLGFFAADGNMIKNKRGTHFIEFQITDKDLLRKIRKCLNSNHKIAICKRNDNRKTSYRLQIGSKQIFNDLLNLGLTPKKSRTINLPNVPQKYFPHFLRGYFDGDGNVNICTYRRKSRGGRLTTILQCGFTSGSEKFLKSLKQKLVSIVEGGTLYYSNRAWRLYFSIKDSQRIYFGGGNTPPFRAGMKAATEGTRSYPASSRDTPPFRAGRVHNYMYVNQIGKNQLYLKRKKIIFEKFMK